MYNSLTHLSRVLQHHWTDHNETWCTNIASFLGPIRSLRNIDKIQSGLQSWQSKLFLHDLLQYSLWHCTMLRRCLFSITRGQLGTLCGQLPHSYGNEIWYLKCGVGRKGKTRWQGLLRTFDILNFIISRANPRVGQLINYNIQQA